MAIKSALSSVSVLGVARLARTELSDVIEAASSAGVIGVISLGASGNSLPTRQRPLCSTFAIFIGCVESYFQAKYLRYCYTQRIELGNQAARSKAFDFFTMGFDCGFDIYPRLEATALNKESYQQFLDEIKQAYGDIYDKGGRRADGKVLSTSTDFDHSDRAYIWFMVGECPHMPSNSDRCNYFLRFSSKISGRLTTPAEPYIRGVHSIALKHFGSRVHFWHEMNETGDERQWGYYDWREVQDASRTLRALEAGQDPKNCAWEERQETKSMPSDTNLSPACGTSRLGLEKPLVSAALPRNGMEENIYAIRLISGKGQGLVATSKIHKGAHILSEAPIFKVRRDEPDHQVANDQIVSALKSLDRDHQRAFFSLHNVYGKSHSPFLGIARTNILPLGSEAEEGGLFLEASRINHSCRRNAQNTWNENVARLTIHALCDVETG